MAPRIKNDLTTVSYCSPISCYHVDSCVCAWDVSIRGAEATIRGRPRPHLCQQAWAPQLYLAVVLTLRFTPPPPPPSRSVIRSSSTRCLGRSYLPAFVWFPRPRSAPGSTSPLSQVPDPFIAPSPMLSVKFPWTN